LAVPPTLANMLPPDVSILMLLLPLLMLETEVMIPVSSDPLPSM